jgi:hypothetical protein
MGGQAGRQAGKQAGRQTDRQTDIFFIPSFVLVLPLSIELFGFSVRYLTTLFQSQDYIASDGNALSRQLLGGTEENQRKSCQASRCTV